MSAGGAFSLDQVGLKRILSEHRLDGCADIRSLWNWRVYRVLKLYQRHTL